MRTKSLELLGRATGAFDRAADGQRSVYGLPQDQRQAVLQDVYAIMTDAENIPPAFAAYMDKLAGVMDVLAEPTRSAMRRLLHTHGAVTTARLVFEQTVQVMGEMEHGK